MTPHNSHPYKCEHKELKHCKECNICYCESCKEEWKKEKINWNSGTISIGDFPVTLTNVHNHQGNWIS